MYKANYKITVAKMPMSEADITAVLRASFRFGNQVSYKDREIISARYATEGALKEYFAKVESARIVQTRHDPGVLLFEGVDRDIAISPYIFALGFNAVVTSKKPLPLEKMLNLESLNHFVLYGGILI